MKNTQPPGIAEHAADAGGGAGGRRRRRLALAFAGLGLAALVAAAVVAGIAPSVVRSLAAKALESRLGRQVSIEAAELDWGAPSMLVLHGVSVAAPEWARERRAFQARRIEAELAPAAWLRGDPMVSRVKLEQPALVIERRGDASSWGQVDSGGAKLPATELIVSEGRIVYLDAGADTDVVVDLAQRRADPNGELPLFARAAGRLRGEELALVVHAESLGQLAQRERPWRVRLEGRVGKTRVGVDGTVRNPLTLDGVDCALNLSGPSLARLETLFGWRFPRTAPYRIEGRFRRDAKRWSLDDASAKFGSSDLAGSFAWDAREEPRRIAARLASKSLSLVDVMAAISPGGDEHRRRVPVEATVDLAARQVVREGAPPLRDLATTLHAKDRIATFEPLRFGVAGGRIEGVARIDRNVDPAEARVELRLAGLRIEQLLPKLGRNASGRLYGGASLIGRGGSFGEVMASADGALQLAVPNGTVNRALLDLAGLDATAVLRFLAARDERVPVSCAVAAFDFRKGVARVTSAVLETPTADVVAQGSVDFASRRIEMKLARERRGIAALIGGPGGLAIGGDLGRPVVTPEPVAFGMRGLASLALGAIHPLLALAPLIETGGGELRDTGCDALRKRGRGSQNAHADPAPRVARRATAPARPTPPRPPPDRAASRTP